MKCQHFHNSQDIKGCSNEATVRVLTATHDPRRFGDIVVRICRECANAPSSPLYYGGVELPDIVDEIPVVVDP